jgi:23S rRNA pseudouridine1911/1915/1917 synthase
MQVPDDYFIAWPASGAASLSEQIRERIPALSRERLKEAFNQGRISVTGATATAGDHPRPGSRIEATVTREDADRFRAGPRAGEGFFLLYRDDDVAVVDKDPGVLTVPTDEAPVRGPSGESTLVERVESLLGRVLPVHRLDRFTSGVLVMVRHETAKRRLIEQFAAHSIVRRYLAITRGVPNPRRGTFRSRLESDARRVQHVSTRGDLAITHYEVLEELGGCALVLAVLETGKRNQIRVHFAEAGWPLVGEHRYVERADKELGRQALHAAELEFRHPRGGGAVSAASPLPEDLRRFLERRGRPGR